MRYVSLHHHSTYSYQDGYGPVKDHVERAAELGMSALALTEHGNVSSHVQLEKESNAAGIKPIFGLEAYCAPEDMREQKNRRKWHLTLLAENEEGYRNLMRIVTRSWAEGFYQWPTVHGRWLREFGEGIIALSGCADSHLSCTLLGGKGRETGDEREALAVMRRYKGIFGDRYYVEAQMFPELERTRTLNPWFEEAARKLDVPLIATADCHYPFPDDNKMQVILHAAGRGIANVDTAESQWEYDIRLCPPSSDAVVLERLRGTGLSKRGAEAALAATEEVAARCSVVLPKVEMLKFPLPRGVKSGEELIWNWLRQGWKFRWGHNRNLRENKKAYVARLKYEMEMIVSKGYVDYFLMLSEAVRWCKNRDIAVGPARGSAAASLACYLLRITEIDPIPFPNMLFERFIDVTRMDLPDVDLDFDDERRGELAVHLMDLYGADRVAAIGTYTKYRGKNALIDVARVHDIPGWEIQPVKDLMIERSGGDSRVDSSLEDTVGMFPQAQAVFDKHPELEYALRLEGNYKGMSIHAAGLVISNSPLTDNVATYTRESKGKRRQVLSVDKYDAEYLGMLKADFLGLTTMGMIRRALDAIGMKPQDLYTIALDDEKVIDAFRQNDVVGIFQFGGGATKIVNGDVAPDNFLELCDINALSRPGPLHSGSTNDYINVKHGRAEPEHFHPIVDRITQHTQYQIIYQEQILQIIREIGDLPWAQVAQIRKVISLKKGEGVFNEQYEDFVAGAQKLHGIDRALSDRIWRRIVTAGQYAFNAAHCVSYSMLAYWQMWLKVHHPEAFYAACLAKYKKQEYLLLRDALKHGMTILPPDLKKSGVTWAAGAEGIRAGFSQVSGIGAKAYTIVEDRDKNGEFGDWGNLARIAGIGPKTAETMRTFAEHEDPFGIHRVDRVLDLVRKSIAKGELMHENMKGRLIPMPRPTYKGGEIPTNATNLPVVYVGIPQKRNPQDVIEDERARTGKTLEEVTASMKDPHLSKKMVVEAFDDSDVLVYLRWSRWDFPRFADALWDMNLGHDVLIVKGVKKGGFGTGIHVKQAWCIDPNDLIEVEEEDNADID